MYQDTCEGFLKLAQSKKAGQTLNIGSGKEISIEKLVNTISEIIGVNPKIECEDNRIRPKNSEVDRLLCDNTKIKLLAGFEPKISLKGLIKTVDWMRVRDNIIKYKSNIYNV